VNDAYFGGLSDVREVMLSMSELHDQGNPEAVSRQLDVARVVETLQREIAVSLNQARSREALRLFRLFAHKHKSNPDEAREAIRSAIELIAMDSR
jgi:hypothetical protein